MIIPILFTIFPTMFVYLLVSRANILRSFLLRLSLSWFLGQYLSTWAIFVLATLLKIITFSVLRKASILFLVILCFGLIFLRSDLRKLIKTGKFKIWYFGLSKNLILLLLCFIFSFFFFKSHLAQSGDNIYTSPAYWDFNMHFPIIQNFVYGDNFPPQTESFSGVPMTYHYFFDLLTSIYSTLGLGLAGGINFISIMSFTAMLVSIIGLSEELFRSSTVGVIAVFFTLTSSSLRFLDYFAKSSGETLIQTVKAIINNNQHPFFFSFVKGNPFGYNGTMFNIFYFLAERQLIFAALFLTFYLAVVYHQNRFSKWMCFSWGIIFGLFFQWHLFATITIAASLLFLLLFQKKKNKLIMIAAGYAIPVIFNFLRFRFLMKSEWFLSEINNFPKINLNFPTMTPEYPFSLVNVLGYYIYAYGFKILFAAVGFYLIFKKDKQIFLLLASIIIPTFVLVNTVQLSPLSVWDNHKWLRPINVFVDIIASVFVSKLLFRKPFFTKAAGIIAIAILAVSGFIELMPFLNSKPASLYASYPTKFIQDIREMTPPQSAFLSSLSKELHLAGRKLYLGSSADEPGATSIVDSNIFDKARREKIIQKIYSSANVSDFCQLLLSNNIDYAQISKNLPIYPIIQTFPSFTTTNEKQESVIFIDVKQGCKDQ